MGKLSRINLPLAFLTIAVASFVSCREVAVPKPKGYFRIDLPQKKYRMFNEADQSRNLPLKFEYPVYGNISEKDGDNPEPGWFNIEFPAYKARIYLTYKDVNNNLESLTEQTYTMNVKNHITKADAINEQLIDDNKSRVFGILYDLKGNTASAVQFYVTDSTNHYLRGSLYFESEPNADSLAPVIDFFRADVIHLIETLKWKEK
ncbi:MAG TPA: gliding motility lipoprotein GldD [Bacteroidales bacterium]|nr:gliding motility lipoprotein GldD [Bacteroidales bacterium]